MTKQELAAIESRANAATREPWIVDGTYVPTASLSAVSVYGMGMEVAECQMDADGAFIAAARVDVPALIAEVRRLRVERDALQVRNSEFWDAPAVSRVEWDALRAERDALNAEVQQSRLEFQVMQKHAQQDAAEIQRLRAERDALRKVYEAAEDFIGAQGTAYEADQYLMLCGVLKSYNAALEAQP
jgi:hypothetical protein